MKPILLFLIMVLSLHPEFSYCQNNQFIHTIRLGNIRTTHTIYNGHSGQTGKITYDELLANSKLVCDMPGCAVTQFTITFIPPGRDLFGPFKTNGAELTARNKDSIKNWKDTWKSTDKKIKIVIEDIHISRNGTDETIKGSLYYECK